MNTTDPTPMTNTMNAMITDKEIADNVREALKQIKDEILELYTLCEDWPEEGLESEVDPLAVEAVFFGGDN